jgi:hypothetical protein
MIKLLICLLRGHKWGISRQFRDGSGDNIIYHCTRCGGEIHRRRDYVTKKWRSF